MHLILYMMLEMCCQITASASAKTKLYIFTGPVNQ